MDYHAAYDRIISHFQASPPIGYSEVHHIIPRSLGGDNSAGNLVALTPKAHFTAHRLLAKMHGGKMWAALAYMARGGTKSARGVQVTARTYAVIKQADAAWRSEHYTENNPYRGKKHSAEVRDKMSGPRPSTTGDNHHRYGKSFPDAGVVISFVKTYDPSAVDVDLTVRNRIDRLIIQTPDGVKKLNSGYRRSKAAKVAQVGRELHGAKNPNYGNGQAISGEKNPMYGKQQTDATKAKIGAKARRRTTCPHCGKVGNLANMARWHFDNCRDPRNPAVAASIRVNS